MIDDPEFSDRTLDKGEWFAAEMIKHGTATRTIMQRVRNNAMYEAMRYCKGDHQLCRELMGEAHD